jgi:hypothetical protein
LQRPFDPGKARTTVKNFLRTKQELHKVSKAQENYHSTMPSYTIFELATGGCLDTIAAGLTGAFHHLGGTEDVSTAIGRAKAKLFSDITGAKCYGDTRGWRKWSSKVKGKVDYLKSGQPCTDYASLGAKTGRHGKTGDLFLEQTDLILEIEPKIFRLEMCRQPSMSTKATRLSKSSPSSALDTT